MPEVSRSSISLDDGTLIPDTIERRRRDSGVLELIHETAFRFSIDKSKPRKITFDIITSAPILCVPAIAAVTTLNGISKVLPIIIDDERNEDEHPS